LNHHDKIIGREREKHKLTELFKTTRRGTGNLVLIAGEAGIGKTVLAEEMLSQSDISVYTERNRFEALPQPPHGRNAHGKHPRPVELPEQN